MSKGKLLENIIVGINGIACVPVLMFGAILVMDFLYPGGWGRFTGSFHMSDIWVALFLSSFIVWPCSAIAFVNGFIAAFARQNISAIIAFALFAVDVGVACLLRYIAAALSC